MRGFVLSSVFSVVSKLVMSGLLVCGAFDQLPGLKGVRFQPNHAHAFDSIEELSTAVITALPPEEPGQNWFFPLAAGGRVLRVKPEDRSSIEILKAVAGTKRFVEIRFRYHREFDQIESITLLPEIEVHSAEGEMPIEPLSLLGSEDILPNSTSSILLDPSLGRVDFRFANYELNPQGIYDYFRSFRLRRNSQCFHRAYYWAHQLWRETGVLSHKVFMFFSWKYIRHYNYHWWFHVAPYVHNEQGEEVVIDATFLSGPVSMKRWTDNFLRNDPVCPIVSKYMGHSAHGKDDWCYLVKKPMHYYHPNTVEEANRNGTTVYEWQRNWLSYGRSSR